MNALLSRNALNKFLAWGTYSKWFPGADTEITNAFRR
jgi:hypothetical protein